MLYETEAEYTTAITATQSAIARQIAIGNQHSNDSGGSSRSTTEVTLPQLRTHLLQLRQELKIIKGDGGFLRFGAGW